MMAATTLPLLLLTLVSRENYHIALTYYYKSIQKDGIKAYLIGILITTFQCAVEGTLKALQVLSNKIMLVIDRPNYSENFKSLKAQARKSPNISGPNPPLQGGKGKAACTELRVVCF